MEAYILDDLLRRVEVIDRYESFIWTERWREMGDFQLIVESTPEMRAALSAGTKLATNESNYVMVVENVENKNDTDGKRILTASGRSLEKILEERVATDGMHGLSEDSDWIIRGTPGYIARQIFQNICVDGILSASDKIPFIKSGSMYPPVSIPEANVIYTAAIPINTVYGAIKELCDIHDLGFRLTRKQDRSELYFEIYTGTNRTSHQSDFPTVIFSPELNNMKNTTEIVTIKDYKNVAYVFSKNGSTMVYADGASSNTKGFERRILFVDANDVDEPAGSALTAILQSKGYDALAEHRSLSAFDGELDQYSAYRYGLDYRLGDIVEMRNSDGATNSMRVTEQIFVSDAEGSRSYPTLTIDLSVIPGTWDSWEANVNWDDDEETWDE